MSFENVITEDSRAPADSGEVVISVQGLGKSYQMYERPSHRLLQGLFGKRRSYYKHFWALRNTSFEVRRGETLGVIGRNGSGKSTLLQMIAGTLTPTEGSVAVNGRVAALLELGSGFNPDFTGRENVYLNATILGLSRAQIDARLQSILEFADIGEFIDQPVRSYSSGMVVRLAFAVIVHVDADILIIDEALSVGDAFFSQKCMRFLRNFQKNGTLLFVSHDAAAVTNLCARALWLEGGSPRLVGTAQEVVEAYMTEQHAAERKHLEHEQIQVIEPKRSALRSETAAPDFRSQALKDAGVSNRLSVFEFDPEHVGLQFGARKATIVRVALLDESGASLGMLSGGEIAMIEVDVRLDDTLEGLIIGFYVKDRLGQRLFGDNTHFAHIEKPLDGSKGDVFRARFSFRMPMLPFGSYMIDAAVASGTRNDHTQQHWIHDAVEFRALDETMRSGLVGIPMLNITVDKSAPQ